MAWITRTLSCCFVVTLVLLLTGTLSASFAGPGDRAERCNKIEVFHRTGCPHCDKALRFLDDLKARHPSIEILDYEVGQSAQNRNRFLAINRDKKVSSPGVPSLLICGTFFVGFDDRETTGRQIEQVMGLGQAQVSGQTRSSSDSIEPAPSEVISSWLGRLDSHELGLPLFTVALGLVDGFNPCAMWVLLFLLSLLVNLRDRRRIALIAGVFVLASGAVYFAFMAAWLNMFLIIGFSRPLQVAVGLVAILIGLVHIQTFFSSKSGLSLSIPERAKPGLYARVRRVIQAENLYAALLGVSVLAVVVNLIELMCTAGLPAVYTQVLTQHGLDTVQYYLYLLLYNLAYMFDDALMVGITVYTLTRYKLQPSQGRWLKLLSGGVVLALGFMLVFVPGSLI